MKSLTDRFTLRNGYEIPCVGYGTWQTPDGDVAVKAVREAIVCGYRHIDEAACYNNEASIGKGIKESGIDRRELFITSKVWNTECNAALYSRQKKHFIFDRINTITAFSFR